jgi:hypothetical protein
MQRRLERIRAQEFANQIKNMSEKGEHLYAEAEEEHVANIPPNAIRGRIASEGKTFCGMFNQETGVIRIDCAEDEVFYLEIDLKKTSIWFQPGAPGAIEAEAHATVCAQQILSEPPTTQTNVQQPLTWQEKLRCMSV